MNARSEWLAQRRTGIGGSDVAGIVGISPWNTPMSVYNDKLGLVDDDKENEAMHWGNRLETVVAEEFADRMGFKIQRRNSMFRHKEIPYLLGNIDRYIVGEKAVLEVKTANAFAKDQWGESGSDEVPFYYLTQVMHYMTVTGYRRAFLAVLIGGNDFRWYEIPYKENLANALIEKCVKFWEGNVIARITPDPVSIEDIKRIYGKAQKGLCVDADEDTIEQVKLLRQAQHDMKVLKADESSLKLEIQKFMKEADTLLGPDGKPVITWKSSESNRFDQKLFAAEHADLFAQYKHPQETRRMLVKKEKTA